MTTPHSDDLPEFEQPPLAEVAIAVQFQRLTQLTTPQLANWSELRKRLPLWETKAPLPLQQEWFGIQPGRPLFEFPAFDDEPRVRSWFLNEERTELLQVQDNCIVKNWKRSAGSEPYPRYPQLREAFARDYDELAKFVRATMDETLTATQCELSYINDIPLDDEPPSRVLTSWQPHEFGEFLPRAEQGQLASSFVIRTGEDSAPRGRLHIQAFIRRDDARRVQLRLVARGAPAGHDLDSVLTWLDLGREWIVRGFASCTTPHMHARWKRVR